MEIRNDERNAIMEQKDILLAHMDDLAEKAKNAGCAASRFLTPTEDSEDRPIGKGKQQQRTISTEFLRL